MRSLWDTRAAMARGGAGSEALTGYSDILDGLSENARPTHAFNVRPEQQVSRHAIMVTGATAVLDPETAEEEA